MTVMAPTHPLVMQKLGAFFLNTSSLGESPNSFRENGQQWLMPKTNRLYERIVKRGCDEITQCFCLSVFIVKVQKSRYEQLCLMFYPFNI